MKTFRRGSIRRDRAAAACLLTFPGFSPGCSCGPVARRPRGPREPTAPMPPACPTGCGLIRSMSAHRARPVPGMPSAVTSPQAAPTALAAARARTEAHPTREERDTDRSARGHAPTCPSWSTHQGRRRTWTVCLPDGSWGRKLRMDLAVPQLRLNGGCCDGCLFSVRCDAARVP